MRSTHGGKSKARDASSCNACRGFAAVVETARMTAIVREISYRPSDIAPLTKRTRYRMVPSLDATWDMVAVDAFLHLLPPRRPTPPHLPALLEFRLQHLHPAFAALRDARPNPVHCSARALLLIFMHGVLNLQYVRESQSERRMWNGRQRCRPCRYFKCSQCMLSAWNARSRTLW